MKKTKRTKADVLKKLNWAVRYWKKEIRKAMAHKPPWFVSAALWQERIEAIEDAIGLVEEM